MEGRQKAIPDWEDVELLHRETRLRHSTMIPLHGQEN